MLPVSIYGRHCESNRKAESRDGMRSRRDGVQLGRCSHSSCSSLAASAAAATVAAPIISHQRECWVILTDLVQPVYPQISASDRSATLLMTDTNFLASDHDLSLLCCWDFAFPLLSFASINDCMLLSLLSGASCCITTGAAVVMTARIVVVVVCDGVAIC